MKREYPAGPRRRRPTHPGRLIASSLEALGMTVYAAAKGLGVRAQTLHNLIDGTSAVSPEMALRLDRFFDTGSPEGAEFWVNMQRDVDLWDAKQKLGKALDKIEKVTSAPARR